MKTRRAVLAAVYARRYWPFYCGGKAGRHGEPLAANPYKRGTQNAAAWAAGWEEVHVSHK
jgi:hypothetical protein